MFFGQDSIVHLAIEVLLKLGHIALLDAGGIGKTSIVKAILNNDAIIECYKVKRHLVTFDNLDTVSGVQLATSVHTFLSCLAHALRLQLSKVDLQKLVMWQLQSSHILLVIDNAETILDRGEDSGHIALAIMKIVALPSVSVLFTTRSAKLPYTIDLEIAPAPHWTLQHSMSSLQLRTALLLMPLSSACC